eukprot:TRINITY_DN3844_c0_g1_i2.p1 TRINITY_DN3844_c0_g1~~TRINITY_DN3844_c0_g1_i2.p1  ORF type:complete len:1216 (+),score=188.81 TRINITY_DN3844_c0_g1_i2:471-4118(+)
MMLSSASFHLLLRFTILLCCCFLPNNVQSASLPFEIVYRDPFSGHRYMLVNRTMSYLLAKQAASDLGGYLATITSQWEYEYIKENIMVNRADECVWMGAALNVDDGSWVWETGPEGERNITIAKGTDLYDCPYACPWSSGEPDNNSGTENRLGLCAGLTDFRIDQSLYILVEFGNNSILMTSMGTEGGVSFISFLGYDRLAARDITSVLLEGDVECLMSPPSSNTLLVRCYIPPSTNTSTVLSQQRYANVTILSSELVHPLIARFSYAPPRIRIVSHVAAGVTITIKGNSFGANPSALTIKFGKDDTLCGGKIFLQTHTLVTCSVSPIFANLTSTLPITMHRMGIQASTSIPFLFNRNNKHFYKITDYFLSFTGFQSHNIEPLYIEGLFPEITNSSSSSSSSPSSLSLYPPLYLLNPVSNSFSGYLATITNHIENDFVARNIQKFFPVLVGLFGTNNNASWMGGPEAGMRARDIFILITSANPENLPVTFDSGLWKWSTSTKKLRGLLEYGPNLFSVTPTILPSNGGNITISGDAVVPSSGRIQYLTKEGRVAVTCTPSPIDGNGTSTVLDVLPSVSCWMPPGLVADNITFAYNGVPLCEDCALLSYMAPSFTQIRPYYIPSLLKQSTPIMIVGNNLPGSRFFASISVSFGTYPCVNITSAQEYTAWSCILPAGIYTGKGALTLGIAVDTMIYNTSITFTPSVTLIEPGIVPSFSSSPSNGGAMITVSGINFPNPDTAMVEVYVGRYPCTNIQIVLPTTQFTCVLPYLVVGSEYLEMVVDGHRTISDANVTFSCGDGVCDIPGGETCVTCPNDCVQVPCGVCGDGVCEPNRGESCTSCRLDCGACPSICPGTPSCSGHGDCVSGVCACTNGWTGPSCFDKLANSTATSNGTSVVIETNNNSPNSTSTSTVSFGINIVELQELSQDGTVLVRYPINKQMFQHMDMNNTTSNYVTFFGSQNGGDLSLWDYYTLFGNGIRIIVQHVYFDRTVLVQYAGSNTTFFEDSLKSTIIIGDFPFSDITHQLGVVLSQSVVQDTVPALPSPPVPNQCRVETNQNVKNATDTSGSLIWAQLVSPSSGTLLYSTFNPYAIVDGKRIVGYTQVIPSPPSTPPSSSSSNSTSLYVRIVVPAFTREAVLDPTFGVLLNLNPSPSRVVICSSPDDGNLQQEVFSSGIIAAIVVPVTVVVVVVVLGLIIYRLNRNTESKRKSVLVDGNDML